MRSLVMLLGVAIPAAAAQAQTLGVQGDRFTIDGTPKFLTFISFFGAMGAPNIAADLHLLRARGFDGVRIWPNLDTGPQLMNGDGSLRPDELARLLFILDQARQERLVVDVTFTYEHIVGMTPATARIGIMNATSALRRYDNLIFDIQNERNVYDRRYMEEADVARIFAGIKAVDPARLATCDNSLGEEDWGPQWAADFTARLGLDVTAFHERRHDDWYTLPFYQWVVGTLRSNGKPAYLQEPNSTRDNSYAANDRADYYLRAIANAKLAGAAAWCFHTMVGVDFRTGPEFLEDRLRAFPEPEWTFVNSLAPRVVLQASDRVHYLVPEAGGGYGVRADRTASGPGSWQIFDVVNLSGGPLVSGDRVALRTADGTHYLVAENGGGGALRASSTKTGPFESFTIQRTGGGVIRHGEALGLRAGDSSWYIVASGGGGGTASADSVARGAWETFTLLFVTPHSSDVAPLGLPAAALDRLRGKDGGGGSPFE